LICAPLRPPDQRFCENDSEARQVFLRPNGRSCSPSVLPLDPKKPPPPIAPQSIARSISPTRASRGACGLRANGGQSDPEPVESNMPSNSEASARS
jgi:hypothetical protein